MDRYSVGTGPTLHSGPLSGDTSSTRWTILEDGGKFGRELPLVLLNMSPSPRAVDIADFTGVHRYGEINQ